MRINIRASSPVVIGLVALVLMGCQPKYRSVTFRCRTLTPKPAFAAEIRMGKNKKTVPGGGDFRKGRSSSLFDASTLSADWFSRCKPSIVWWYIDENVSKATRWKDAKYEVTPVAFPVFDPSAESWECTFYLQRNDQWSGRFAGVVLTPIDDSSLAPIPTALENEISDQQLPIKNRNQVAPSKTPWIEYQFRDPGGIWLGKVSLLHPDGSSIRLNEHCQSRTGTGYYGCLADGSPESVFRPRKGSKIIVNASRLKDNPVQEFDVPNIDNTAGFCCFVTVSREKVVEVTFKEKFVK